MGIIAGIGLLGAGLAWLRRRHKQNTGTSVAYGNISECLEIKEKVMAERLYCGPDGSQIVEQIANELITDPQLRQHWNEFDQRFLEQCVMAGEQGLVFNHEGATALSEVDVEFLRLGVKIYNGANREAVHQRSTRYRVLNLLAMIYYMALRASQ